MKGGFPPSLINAATIDHGSHNRNHHYQSSSPPAHQKGGREEEETNIRKKVFVSQWERRK
ncbi:hypothetical protein CsSME_00033321 [Camellia sinensis var. sinensis]